LLFFPRPFLFPWTALSADRGAFASIYGKFRCGGNDRRRAVSVSVSRADKE
jgi:hypothetical protein